MHLRHSLGLIGLTAAALALPAAPAAADNIRVQSTTDTVDAGLVEGILRAAYTAANPGDTFDYTGVGTGKALDNARAGLGDVVITHAPSLEAKFVADGYSLEPVGRAIFYSDYIIIAPLEDPAGVLAAAPHDAVAAFEAIAAAGAAGKATFVSRGDNSGTNVQEQLMWGLTTTVQKQAASNASGNAERFEPGSGGTYPAWYGRTNKGQAASVSDTNVCAPASYPNGGCYTLVDRGTFNKLVNGGTVTKLKLVTEKNLPGARGGENLLINPFSAYIVNPAKFADPSKFNVAGATRFLDFLTSESFQTQLETFPSAADPAFRADAFPLITTAAAPPASAASGSTLNVEVAATNRLPGGGVVDGLPLQLQVSTDGQKTWGNVGDPVAADAAGKATFRPTIAATSAYRVTWQRYRQFSPSTSLVGSVFVAQAAPPKIDPPKADKTAPTVTKAKLTKRKLTFQVSEPGAVKVTLKRKVAKRSGKKVTFVYRTAKTFTIKVTKAGTVSRTFKAIKTGTYRVTLRATDAAGNVKTKSSTLKLKG